MNSHSPIAPTTATSRVCPSLSSQPFTACSLGTRPPRRQQEEQDRHLDRKQGQDDHDDHQTAIAAVIAWFRQDFEVAPHAGCPAWVSPGRR
jgi:hypothetical protein